MKKDSKADSIGGTLFVGTAIIGVGIGFIVDQLAVGAVLGVGVGFIVLAIARLLIKK